MNIFNPDPISKYFAKHAGQNGLVTIMYHGIWTGAETPSWPFAVSYKSFCEQMNFLHNLGWKTVCAREAERYSNIPLRTACITFDDGYADNYRAFETLSELGMCASWFIVSRDVGRRSSWPGESLPFQRMLTENQLREMASAGMEIGSHTVSHCKLTEVDAKTILSELSDSQKALSDILSEPVTSLAYPYGLYNARVTDATRHAGYHVALTTDFGFGMIDNDLMRLRRVTIYNTDTLSTFARKLFFDWEDVGWDRIRKYAMYRLFQRIHLLSANES